MKDFFDVPNDVYPIGRLDYDSEGLLILSNDKKLNHALLNPEFEHEREYWAQVDGAITMEAINDLRNGVDITIDGKIYRTKKCGAMLMRDEPVVPERNPPIRVRKSIPTSWVKLVLTEGKNMRISPGTNPSMVNFSIRFLINLSVGYPTAAVILRTCLFLPSVRTSRTQLVGICAR